MSSKNRKKEKVSYLCDNCYRFFKKSINLCKTHNTAKKCPTLLNGFTEACNIDIKKVKTIDDLLRILHNMNKKLETESSCCFCKCKIPAKKQEYKFTRPVGALSEDSEESEENHIKYMEGLFGKPKNYYLNDPGLGG